jgi:nitrate reductase delta subunit
VVGGRWSVVEKLATLLDYPDESTRACLVACLDELRAEAPDAVEALGEWERYVVGVPVWDVQELYTQTFDLNPVCSLDVGYYLFGEDYQRGLLLALLRESQEEAGMTDEQELPDHLPVVLRWLARVQGSELHTDMVSECVLPAMRKMDECLAGGTNPYRGLLQAIERVLAADLAARGIPVAEHSVRIDERRAAFLSPPGSAPRAGELPMLSDDLPACGAAWRAEPASEVSVPFRRDGDVT